MTDEDTARLCRLCGAARRGALGDVRAGDLGELASVSVRPIAAMQWTVIEPTTTRAATVVVCERRSTARVAVPCSPAACHLPSTCDAKLMPLP